ncbi:MAG: hypothetical protein WCK67_12200 [bacterium]
MVSSLGQKLNLFAATQQVEKPVPFSGTSPVQTREATAIPVNAFTSLEQKYNAQPLGTPPKMAGIGTSFMQAGALGNEGAVAYDCLGKKGVVGGGLNLLG